MMSRDLHMSYNSELKGIVASIKSYIELERASGVEEIFSVCGDKRQEAGNKNELDSLREEVLNCRRCSLHKTRRNVVFGAGNTGAGLMFVG